MLKIEKKTLIIVYVMSSPLVTYIILDQMLHENVAKVVPLIQNFNLSQHSQYSTHAHRKILDLIF